MVTASGVTDALEAVHDPHVPLSIVRMSMVSAVEVKPDGVVTVVLRMPCLSCPGVTVLEDRIVKAISHLDGVTGVIVDFGWGKAWEPELVEATARATMKAHGLLI